jgi:hypothetical protein
MNMWWQWWPLGLKCPRGPKVADWRWSGIGCLVGSPHLVWPQDYLESDSYADTCCVGSVVQEVAHVTTLAVFFVIASGQVVILINTLIALMVVRVAMQIVSALLILGISTLYHSGKNIFFFRDIVCS